MVKKAFYLALLLAFALALPVSSIAFAANAGVNILPSGASTQAPRVNVAIQAGHWKSNELPEPLARLCGSTGANGGGRTEAQVTLDIAQHVVSILRGRGLTAEVLPATVPTGYQADLFISLHADGNGSASARGYKVSTRWRSDVAAMDAMLVQSIDNGYRSITRMPSDPSVTRAMSGYYAYSTYRGEEYRLASTTPAAILEMGFMTNGSDRALMFNNPELVARGSRRGRRSGQLLRPAACRPASASRSRAASRHQRIRPQRGSVVR